MSGYKDPDFQDRRALAQKARAKALEKLADAPKLDEATIANRIKTFHDESEAAIDFYERLGGIEISSRNIGIGRWRLKEVCYLWPDLHIFEEPEDY